MGYTIWVLEYAGLYLQNESSERSKRRGSQMVKHAACGSDSRLI